MNIGEKMKQLRLQNGFTQEELAERTNLTKGHISQLERALNSPSIETLFALLEVLGTTPKDFFDDSDSDKKIIFSKDEQTQYCDNELGYQIRWLVPSPNEKMMEPVQLTFQRSGQFKTFEPSNAETFIFVQNGTLQVDIGHHQYHASTNDTIYYKATHRHTLTNIYDGETTVLLVATNSYL